MLSQIKRLCFIKTIICLILIFWIMGFSLTLTAQEKEEYLVLSARVTKILDSENIESSHMLAIAEYEVLAVCDGIYNSKTIKVAQNINMAKELKVGDKVSFKLRKTDIFRIMTKFLIEDVGYYTPEEYIVDYIFEDFSQPCTNQAIKH